MPDSITERGTCPSCGSGEITHVLCGFPANPNTEPEKVRSCGCIMHGEPQDRECSVCGHNWVTARAENDGLTAQQHMLHDYALSIDGGQPRFGPDGQVHFDLHGVPARVRVKEGGGRIRGSAVIAEVEDTTAALEWLSTQPLPPTAELTLWDGEGGRALLRFVWERRLETVLAGGDPIGNEIRAYLEAWRDGTEAFVEPLKFDLADPRDSAPQQAWLVFGDDAAWPTEDELVEQHESGDAGVFEPMWTAAKQTQVGDLLLCYFGGHRRAVHFVARAASAAFYASDIEVNTEGEVRPEQWWVFHTPLIPIEPIRFAALKAASNDQLNLRGRSGKSSPRPLSSASSSKRLTLRTRRP